MKNKIIREMFKRLANAPEIVANEYAQELEGQERADAERLIQLLNLEKRSTTKQQPE